MKHLTIYLAKSLAQYYCLNYWPADVYYLYGLKTKNKLLQTNYNNYYTEEKHCNTYI